MSNLLNAMKENQNLIKTENGATAYSSTLNGLYDMYAFGGSYRQRSDEDCIELFRNALAENEIYALKCLFYLRDARGGAGERRFFRVCIKWLAENFPDMIRRNLEHIPEFGRWDDYYSFVGTSLENEALDILAEQFYMDIQLKAPSLCAKWLPSENATSKHSRKLAELTYKHFKLSPRNYRKTLAFLRKKINIVERLMSRGEWDKIEFDKLPSKAGFRYRSAFEEHCGSRYFDFMANKETKVNAGTLYPYEVVEKASCFYGSSVKRNVINKYWDNLTDYFNKASFNGLAIVDTSNSMTWGNNPRPIDVAISLGLYCAERAKGPFHNHYLSFSRAPKLIECKGLDFVDKVQKIYRANLCENTNLKAAFDFILNTAIKNHLTQEDIPENLIVISDMEIDSMSTDGVPDMEYLRQQWLRKGYRMPNLIYWNVNARNNTILDKGPNVTYVSGCSPVIFEQIMTGKRGIEMMMDKLSSERYSVIF